MDIEYLLALQDLRAATGTVGDAVGNAISFIGGGTPLLIVAFIVYWAVDRRTGLFAVVSFATVNLVNAFIKNLAAVYRPWVRDARIVPSAAAVPDAGGYSFPSGHTTATASTLGALAWWQRKRRWITIVAVVFTLLLMFSRNFLGVHTPQDVAFGLVEAVAAIAGTQLFFTWYDRAPRNDVAIALGAIAVAAVALAIVVLKPYPMDYVDGQLLVDPQEMMRGSFVATGIVIGLATGWLAERRRVRFTTERLTQRERVVRVAVGIALALVWYLSTNVLLQAALGRLWGKMIVMAGLLFVASFVAPAVFCAIERRYPAWIE